MDVAEVSSIVAAMTIGSFAVGVVGVRRHAVLGMGGLVSSAAIALSVAHPWVLDSARTWARNWLAFCVSGLLVVLVVRARHEIAMRPHRTARSAVGAVAAPAVGMTIAGAMWAVSPSAVAVMVVAVTTSGLVAGLVARRIGGDLVGLTMTPP